MFAERLRLKSFGEAVAGHNDRSELDLVLSPVRIANAIAEETLAMVKEKANLIAFPRSLSFR